MRFVDTLITPVVSALSQTFLGLPRTSPYTPQLLPQCKMHVPHVRPCCGTSSTYNAVLLGKVGIRAHFAPVLDVYKSCTCLLQNYALSVDSIRCTYLMSVLVAEPHPLAAVLALVLQQELLRELLALQHITYRH